MFVIQMAPAVRVSLGELFGFKPGDILTKKIIGALKKIGFDYVFDTSFGADVVVMEEAAELKKRLKKGGPFPMINSCCPGTVSFIETAHKNLIPNISSVKSPMEVLGVLIRKYFSNKISISEEDIVSVALMPCIIKKAEIHRSDLKFNGKRIIDFVITTSELASLMKELSIDLKDCNDKDFDSFFGYASKSGKIFGSSGGVSEAILRTYIELNNLDNLKINKEVLRDSKGFRELDFFIGEKNIKIAIINPLLNAIQLLKNKEEYSKYTFIEIMACKGGCVGGAGQPPSDEKTIELRREGLYKIKNEGGSTENSILYSPSKNKEIIQLYNDFLGKPLSPISLKLLHKKK